jgi:hypothetical protein
MGLSVFVSKVLAGIVEYRSYCCQSASRFKGAGTLTPAYSYEDNWT